LVDAAQQSYQIIKTNGVAKFKPTRAVKK